MCHYVECHYDECHYDECHYDEYHYDECKICVFMMNVVAPSVSQALNTLKLNARDKRSSLLLQDIIDFEEKNVCYLNSTLTRKGSLSRVRARSRLTKAWPSTSFTATEQSAGSPTPTSSSRATATPKAKPSSLLRP
jgi:hypothetical protein